MNFYLIETADTERSESFKYITTSLSDAQAHVMENGHLGYQDGSCIIYKVNERFHVLESYRYEKGKLVGHWKN